MKVAFVHDWLVTWRGGEKVLAALSALYPEAPIYTLFYDPSAMPAAITQRQVIAHPLLNRARKLRKALLPLMPRAIESFDLSGYDLLISTSSCVAHGALKRDGARHLCYLHSPMRYVWDQQQEYLDSLRHVPGAAAAIRAVTPRLRAWDVAAAQPDRVDRFVANSSFVAARAQKFYGREAGVVHPPIELGRFRPAAPCGARGGYFLAAGALVSYKRFDLAIEACERLGTRLVVAGKGPMEGAWRKLAGKHTTFVIDPDDAAFVTLMQGAKALLFPGVEDFGMIAVEAMGSGTPVVAFDGGGARDFIQPGVTGAFFKEGSAASLAAALAAFEPGAFDAARIRGFAEGFGLDGFLDRMRAEIDHLMKGAAG